MFRNRMAGLPTDVGRKDWQPEALPCQAESSGPAKRCHIRQLPEIDDFTVAEITDEATYQDDCAWTWRRVFGKDRNTELQAADREKMSEFEMRIRAQYPDVFKEPTAYPGTKVRRLPDTDNSRCRTTTPLTLPPDTGRVGGLKGKDTGSPLQAAHLQIQLAIFCPRYLFSSGIR